MKFGWGGGICLGIYAEVIVHEVYAKNHPQISTSMTENGIRWYILPRR